MREARNVSPAEDDKDDGAEEEDAVPRPAGDADDGTDKVDTITQPTDTEDDDQRLYHELQWQFEHIS